MRRTLPGTMQCMSRLNKNVKTPLGNQPLKQIPLIN